MNKPPEEFVRVEEDRLMDFGVACFKQSGLDEDHAALFTRLLVNCDLRGVRSHGSRNFSGYCSAFETKSANPRPNIRVALVREYRSTCGVAMAVCKSDQTHLAG